MARRTPTAAPVLDGFEFVELVGSGGYADVFLFEQQVPNRRVAIKVLDPGAVPAGSGQQMFTAEANLMAKVSAHPYIVQVFHAGTAPDGRSYLIMEYYPGPNYSDRARAEQLAVAECLQVGIQLSSAIETAHRAGILHRDIKPANILTSEYRRPGLTDFGIASAQGPDSDTADGVSIPWSSPEALGSSAPDRRADIYSLAATVFTLLAGRSPFEVPGGDNRALSLISRIERNPVPSIGRADVPASLERVLANAMAKVPAHRPASAADFGRQLQAVESELRYAVTPLELADVERVVRSRSAEVDDDSTRVKGVTEVRAQDEPGTSIAAVPSAPTPVAPVEQRRREGLLAEPEVDDTMIRPEAPTQATPEAERGSSNRIWLAAGVVAAAIAFVVGGVVAFGGGGEEADADTPQFDEFEVNDNIGAPVAVTPSALEEVVGVASDSGGANTFSWNDRGDGVAYAVTPDDGSTERIEETEFESFAECVEVEVIAESGLISAPTRGCVG